MLQAAEVCDVGVLPFDTPLRGLRPPHRRRGEAVKIDANVPGPLVLKRRMNWRSVACYAASGMLLISPIVRSTSACCGRAEF